LSLHGGDLRHFAGYANVDLEYASKEMAAIEPLVKKAGWAASIPDSPDKALLLRTIESAEILHMATHADFPKENAQDYHSLVIGPEKSADRFLTAGEIRTLDLSANHLAVLSVCNGGLYRVGPGNEVYGLMPAFLEAGSQNVVGTLWPLDDAFGKEFMTEFYLHLSSDGPAGALREASRHFIEKNELIRNWAAFVLMGSGSFPVAPDHGQQHENER